MGGLLDAECVINALFEKGVFTRKFWKLDKMSAGSYDVSFELADSARIAGFTIFIRDACHCIGLTSLLNHSRRFGIRVTDIVSRCALG
jgi:hypothetical protein